MTSEDIAYVAVDWGTSSFRLWLVSKNGDVLHEERTDEGMSVAAEIGFSAVLESHLDRDGLSALTPVIVCGMAGARQGWVEAPYVETPATLSEIAANAVSPKDARREVHILPGVCQRGEGAYDVMRGEETQLLGLVLSGLEDGIVCLPGTHSKWVRLEGERIAAFRTFMTGELYALLSGHSVLRYSLALPEDFDQVADEVRSAVAQAIEKPEQATAQLFSLRAEDLLADTSKERLAARLSGLLIGLEIAGAKAFAGNAGLQSVVLAGAGRLATLYGAAFQAAGIEARTVDADDLARRGLHAAAGHLFLKG
ncbi:MAG: 2-dehydro-3-deoxygalactonokinase [Pseudomonadota bacterium]|nr:2-dehydro-3-deoxygalactonokinase [Pseudomonadota bacterium]